MKIHTKIFRNITFLAIFISLIMANSISYSQGFTRNWGQSFGRPGYPEGRTKVVNVRDGIWAIGYATIEVYKNDIVIYKLDYEGNLIWEKSLGLEGEIYPFDVLFTSGGKVIISVISNDVPPERPAWLYSLDLQGNIEWSINFPDSIAWGIYDIKESMNHNLVAAGSAIDPRSGNWTDFTFVSLSETGEILWYKTFGSIDVIEKAYAVTQTSDGGFVLTGEGGPYSHDAKIIKTDSLGNMEWSKDYGLWQVRGQKLTVNKEDEILLFYSDNDPNSLEWYQLFMKKFRLDGTEISEKRISNTLNNSAIDLYDFTPFKDDTYILASNDGILSTVDKDFNLLWQEFSNFNSLSIDTCFENSIILGGTEYPTNGDIYAALFSLNTQAAVDNNPIHAGSYKLFQNYPNPFNSSTVISFQIQEDTNVRISIFDILGRHITTLLDKKLNSGSHSVTWNGLDDKNNKVASGIYFYRIESENLNITKKTILQN